MKYRLSYMNYDGINDILNNLNQNNIDSHFDEKIGLLEIKCTKIESIFFDTVIFKSQVNHIENIIKRWKNKL